MSSPFLRTWLPLAALGAVFLAGASRTSAVQDKEDPAGGKEVLKVEGKLTADDPKDKVRENSFHKVHTFKMEAGKSYRIDMRSKQVDSFLRLEDPDGKRIAEDDDGGGFPDARIVFNCSKEGTYRIIATTFAGGTGEYTLTVTVTSGGGGELTLKDGRAEAEGKFDAKTPKDKVRENSPAHLYTVKLVAGRTYQIDMKRKAATMDPYLRLEDGNGQQLAEDDDSGGGLDARIVFNCTNAGTYRVIATTLNGGDGAYTLTVQEKK